MGRPRRLEQDGHLGTRDAIVRAILAAGGSIRSFVKTTLAVVTVLMLIAARAATQDLSPVRGAARVVSTVSYLSWDQAQGWVELEDRQTIVEVYGTDGRIQSRERSYGGNALLERTIFTYSAEGVRKLTTDRDDKLLRTAEVIRVDGRTIENVYAADGALVYSNLIQTDPHGRTIEIERRDGEGRLAYRVRYLYDARGNMTEAAYLDPDGTTAFVSSFTYAGFNLRGAWLSRRESCTFSDVRMRPKEIIRRRISAGGAP